MSYLEQPDPAVWQARQAWFEALLDETMGNGGYAVSEQACALVGEVEQCFCAGAWLSVIVMAAAVVDASLREVECPGFEGNSKDLIEAARADPKLQDLRKRRNTLVHVSPDKPAITVDQQWMDRVKLEAEARDAVKLMVDAMFLTPFV